MFDLIIVDISRL